MQELRETTSYALIKADDPTTFEHWISAHPEEAEYQEKSLGYRAIHYAARWSAACLEILIRIGARVDGGSRERKGTISGFRPLKMAARHGNIEALQFLLQAGDEIDYTDRQEGYSALHIAAQENQIRAIDYLVRCGATVDITHCSRRKPDDVRGKTPLFVAASKGRVEAVRRLLTHGADPDFDGLHGESSLHYACYGKKREIFELLIDRGADVSRRRRYPRENNTVLLAFLDSSLSVNIQSKAGEYLEIVKRLVAEGASTEGAKQLGNRKYHRYPTFLKGLDQALQG